MGRGGQNISTHAPLAGRDPTPFCGLAGAYPISTHAPLAGRDPTFLAMVHLKIYFNPRAPCGARLVVAALDRPVDHISTHAPLAGRDVNSSSLATRTKAFQPTRPLRGATELHDQGRAGVRISTHAPLAGRDWATVWDMLAAMRNFNPRAPCGARHLHPTMKPVALVISTHAPLAGRDKDDRARRAEDHYFNPRAPCGARLCRGATAGAQA